MSPTRRRLHGTFVRSKLSWVTVADGLPPIRQRGPPGSERRADSAGDRRRCRRHRRAACRELAVGLSRHPERQHARPRARRRTAHTGAGVAAGDARRHGADRGDVASSRCGPRAIRFGAYIDNLHGPPDGAAPGYAACWAMRCAGWPGAGGQVPISGCSMATPAQSTSSPTGRGSSEHGVDEIDGLQIAQSRIAWRDAGRPAETMQHERLTELDGKLVCIARAAREASTLNAIVNF